MHKKSPEISVIICTYNTKEITVSCLEKLKKSIDFLNREVDTIVVENGSDGTGEFIKKKYPWVKLIEQKDNTGYAKGNNIGIDNASKISKYYLFLNSDALIEKNTLSDSVLFMEKNTECAVLGCQLKFGDGKMQPSAGYLPTPFNTCLWMLGLDGFSKNPVHPKKINFFAKDRKVGWVMGAFLFMRNEVLRQTKGFDENFFMYMEEVEWCRRISKSGFEIWYTPSFAITHLDKASSGFDLKKPLTRELQGLKYYLKKYYPNYDMLVAAVIKMGIVGRWLGFSFTGNNIKANIYRDMMKNI